MLQDFSILGPSLPIKISGYASTVAGNMSASWCSISVFCFANSQTEPVYDTAKLLNFPRINIARAQPHAT